MKRLIALLRNLSTPIGALTGGSFLALFSAPAAAALYGYCFDPFSVEHTQCVDTGVHSPTRVNPPEKFGFTTDSGPKSGDLFIDVLVPGVAPFPRTVWSL
jgi:hypothetical protein